MNIEQQLGICANEINIGLKAKAVNRLNLLIKEYPDEISVRETLGQLYFDAGFYDAAGLQWLLCETTPEREKCVSIYFKTINGSARQALREYKYRGKEEVLPDYALAKLKALQLKANTSGKKNYKQHTTPPPVKEISPIVSNLTKLGCLLFVIVFVIALLIGVIDLFSLVKNQF
nr:DUF6584 family protein [uncultured Flavobacterium sp.]